MVILMVVAVMMTLRIRNKTGGDQFFVAMGISLSFFLSSFFQPGP